MIYLSYLCTRNSAKGSLAQLVQSVCLTSRGSGVRIPQLPQRNGPLTGMRVARFCKERRYGGIAQLVQSACLTGRRSAVQIRMLLLIDCQVFANIQILIFFLHFIFFLTYPSPLSRFLWHLTAFQFAKIEQKKANKWQIFHCASIVGAQTQRGFFKYASLSQTREQLHQSTRRYGFATFIGWGI